MIAWWWKCYRPNRWHAPLRIAFEPSWECNANSRPCPVTGRRRPMLMSVVAIVGGDANIPITPSLSPSGLKVLPYFDISRGESRFRHPILILSWRWAKALKKSSARAGFSNSSASSS